VTGSLFIVLYVSAEFLISFRHTGLEKKDYVMIKIRCIPLYLF